MKTPDEVPGLAANEGAEPGETDPPAYSRRRVLDALLGTAGLAWLGAVIYPVLRYLRPPAEGASSDQISLAPGEIAKLQNQGYVITRMGHDRVIVLRDRHETLHATQAKCTHEACTVRYRQDENLIWCACHNGRFDLAGKVISGPPPRPLELFNVRETQVGDEVAISVFRT